MQVLLGILYHTMGGISSGSFYLPFKKIKGWAWETYWILGGLVSWLILPPLAAYLTIPHFSEIISNANPATNYYVYLMGLIWGVGGLTYGLGVRYLGLSLGNSIILGLTAAFGALVPSIYYNINHTPGKTTFSDLLQSIGGQLVLLGVLFCLIGIGISGWAGTRKETELNLNAKKDDGNEFNLVKGLIIATVSGILSSFFNYGIEAGKPLAEEAVKMGANPLFQNNVTYVVLLWGGLTTNLFWVTKLHFENKTFSDYGNKKVPRLKNTAFAVLAGTLWFMQFFFYGMGESRLGNGASSWILHMATIILTGNLWGLYLNEWKGVSKKTFRMFLLGILVIISSIVLVGLGNTL